MRFKIEAKITETLYSNHEFAKHEIYLYLVDNWFCEKNIIDERYNHKSKEYIFVTLDVFPNCKYELTYFKTLGKRYIMEKVLAIEQYGSFHAGGAGTWHKVKARQINGDNNENLIQTRIATLYFEINKWFVSVQNTH